MNGPYVAPQGQRHLHPPQFTPDYDYDYVTSRAPPVVVRTVAGVRGPPGVRGHPGYPGLQGGVGPTGSKGCRGLQGGVGPTGLKGCPGSVGERGLRGCAGIDGDHGEDTRSLLLSATSPVLGQSTISRTSNALPNDSDTYLPSESTPIIVGCTYSVSGENVRFEQDGSQALYINDAIASTGAVVVLLSSPPTILDVAEPTTPGRGEPVLVRPVWDSTYGGYRPQTDLVLNVSTEYMIQSPHKYRLIVNNIEVSGGEEPGAPTRTWKPTSPGDKVSMAVEAAVSLTNICYARYALDAGGGSSASLRRLETSRGDNAFVSTHGGIIINGSKKYTNFRVGSGALALLQYAQLQTALATDTTDGNRYRVSFVVRRARQLGDGETTVVDTIKAYDLHSSDVPTNRSSEFRTCIIAGRPTRG